MKDGNHNWVAPLPFKSPRCRLPQNRTLAKKHDSQRHFFLWKGCSKMATLKRPFRLRRGKNAGTYLFLACIIPPPPQKIPEKIRVVFDSSAKHNGISLNDVLISGPDLNNTLIGALSRFWRQPVATIADIEQMFHCFLVKREHRNYQRFLWYQDSDPSKDIAEYRMRVHVFRNSSSPAKAIYCLRQAPGKASLTTTQRSSS